MARSVNHDPYMNFRFGLRLSKDSPWLGFTAIGIFPTKAGSGPGELCLEKHFGEELIELMNSGKTNVNIGIFHPTEAPICDDPKCQIDLFGVDFTKATMNPILLDAMGGQETDRTGVLISKISMPYERCDMYVKETALKRSPSTPGSSKADHPVVM